MSSSVPIDGRTSRAAVWRNLGMVGYRESCAIQDQVHQRVLSGEADNTLLLVEHPPVLTLGSGFHPENLLLSPDDYGAHGIEVHTTDRGGDVTFHGPNQLVAYPIFRLSLVENDLHAWLRGLEEAVIRALAHWNIPAERFPPHTGVWVKGRKVCALGVKVRKWVSTHGVALNCNNDLAPFSMIVPCGIKDHPVTSITNELGREVTTVDAIPVLLDAFADVFGLQWHESED